MKGRPHRPLRWADKVHMPLVGYPVGRFSQDQAVHLGGDMMRPRFAIGIWPWRRMTRLAGEDGEGHLRKAHARSETSFMARGWSCSATWYGGKLRILMMWVSR